MTRIGLLPVIGLALLALGLSEARVAAQNNPFGAAYPINFRANGQNGSLTASFAANKPNNGNGEWIAGLNPWNNRNTAKGNPVWNRDATGINFPLFIQIGVNQQGQPVFVQIKQADSDAFWDWYYITQNQDDYVKWGLPKGTFKQLSGSSLAVNCYGYASGKGWVIPRDTPGMVPGAKPAPNGLMLIFADEGWAKQPAATKCKANCILLFTAAPLGDHCVLLVDCCPNGSGQGVDSIKTTREKNGTGGVYEGTWACPPGIDLSPKGDIWCKS